MKQHVLGWILLLSIGVLYGCQSANHVVESTPVTIKTGIPTPEGVEITPYEHPDIQRKSLNHTTP